MQHLVSGCKRLAQKEYKRRHNNVAKKVHWDLCKAMNWIAKRNGVNTYQKEQ